MKISGLSTPALILDVNILKANEEKMRNLLAGTGLKLRPHYKSHKCAALARWQLENGAIGMTCAKLSEAMDALLVLGYTRSEAQNALKSIDTQALSIEDIIKEALKKLMKS